MTMSLPKSHIACAGIFPEPVAEACMGELARDSAMHAHLAMNRALPPGVWHTLWETNPPAGMAKDLVRRRLDPGQVRAVLGSEKRSSVLEVLLEFNELDSASQAALAEVAGPRVASRLLESAWLDADLRLDVSRRADPAGLLAEVCYDPFGLFTDEEAVARITQLEELAKVRHRALSRCLKAFFFYRPETMGRLVTALKPTAFTSAAAGSIALAPETAAALVEGISELPLSEVVELRYVLMALVANPVAPLEVSETVLMALEGHAKALPYDLWDTRAMARKRLDQGRVVDFDAASGLTPGDDADWIVRRALPSDFSEGREVELLVVASSEGLDYATRREAAEVLSRVANPRLLARHAAVLGSFASAGVENEQTVPTDSALWERLAQGLGDSSEAWANFVTLVDSFEGPLEELLRVSASL